MGPFQDKQWLMLQFCPVTIEVAEWVACSSFDSFKRPQNEETGEENDSYIHSVLYKLFMTPPAELLVIVRVGG